MKIENNRIFYVYFCFGIISIAFLSSCNSTARNISNKINVFFDHQKKEELEKCLNSDPELYEIAKKKIDVHNALIESCSSTLEEYDMFKKDTNKILDSLYQNDQSDFVILNMINPNDKSILLGKSTLTVFRKRTEKKIHIFSNHYKYEEYKKEYDLVKDSSLISFNPEKKLKLVEGFLYNKKTESLSYIDRNESFSRYYIIAKINGKYVIKTLYDYSKED